MSMTRSSSSPAADSAEITRPIGDVIAPPASLFAQLGGDAGIAAVVDDFYQRIMLDTLLAPVFGAVDMANLKKHQRRFLTYVMGGANAYSGRGMRHAHADVVKKHGIGDTHFDAVTAHLRAALGAQQIKPELIAQVDAIADSTRDDVLGR